MAKADKIDWQATTDKINAIPIEIKTVTKKEFEDFLIYAAEQKANNPDIALNFQEYIRDRFFPAQENLIIVPSLANLEIGDTVIYTGATGEELSAGYLDIQDRLLDLRNVDFTGVDLTNTKFTGCDLTNANCQDADLSQAQFIDCNLRGADLRGANLNRCKITETELSLEQSDLLEDQLGGAVGAAGKLYIQRRRQAYQGMKLSTTEALLANYGAINRSIFNRTALQKIAELTKEVKGAQAAVNQKYQQLGTLEYYRGTNTEYNQLLAQQKLLQERLAKAEAARADLDLTNPIINATYPIDPSIVELPSLMIREGAAAKNIIYDPAYSRVAKVDAGQNRQYFPMDRTAAEKYLFQIKTEPDLNINEFAKRELIATGKPVAADTKIIADFSPREQFEPGQDVWQQIDLSDLDFSKANLAGGCFAGANLTNSNFKGANLEGTSFEQANLTRVNFEQVIGIDINLFSANVTELAVKDADCSRIFAPHLRGTAMEISNSKFNFGNMAYSDIEGIKIDNSELVAATLAGSNMARAVITRTNLQGANLTGAIGDAVKIIDSDLTQARLTNAKLQQAYFEKTILAKIQATKIDLSDSIIDELCNLQGADLQQAILDRVKAEKIKLKEVNLTAARAKNANFTEALIERTNMRFMNLESAVLDKMQAVKMDATGANFDQARLRQAQIKDSIIKDATLKQADMEQAVLEGIDARGAILQQAILDRVQAKQVRINYNTNLAGAKVDEAQGKLMLEDNQEIDIQEKARQDTIVEAEKGRSKIGAKIRGFFGKIGQGLKKVSQFITKPLKAKYGRIIGGILGGFIAAGTAIGILASAVVTGGTSLLIAGGIVAGAAIVGGVAGAGIGHVAASKLTATSAVAAGAGFMVGGAPGAALGAAAAMAANGLVQNYTGKTVDGHVGAALDAIGNQCALVANAEGAKLVQEYALHQQQYRAETKPPESFIEKPQPIKLKEQVRFNLATKQPAIATTPQQPATIEPSVGKPKLAQKIAQIKETIKSDTETKSVQQTQPDSKKTDKQTSIAK